MNTVFYEPKITSKAFINPADIIKPVDDFPEVCILTFSKKIIDQFASMKHTEVIASLTTANGVIPIYKIHYGGQDFAFCLSLVGAPACVSEFEELIALGAKKFIFFGCCGVLDDQQVQQKIIVPTAAVRDEGTSYHYIAPSEELTPDPESAEILKRCLTKCGYPYTFGKIWTTDAIYRETLDAIAERKNSGCVAVDMEYSALLAAAKYRNAPLIQFFYGADSLDNEVWQPRDLTNYGLNGAEKYMALAFECGLEI